MKISSLLIILTFIIACDQSKSAIEEDPKKQEEREQAFLDLTNATVAFTFKGKVFCSGVLVDSNKVTTAAHCFMRFPLDQRDEIKISLSKPKKSWELSYAERIAYNNGASLPVKLDKKMKISKIHMPDHWERPMIEWQEAITNPFQDIAVVELVNDVPSNYKPVPFYTGRLSNLVNSNVMSFGFGKDLSSDWYARKTMKISKGKVKRAHSKGIFNGFLQVLYEGSQPCKGDSGGGVFTKVGSQWYLIGNTSGVFQTINDQFRGIVVDVIIGETDICEAGDISFTIAKSHFGFLSQYLDVPHLEVPENEYSAWDYSSMAEYCQKAYFTVEEQIFVHKMLHRLPDLCSDVSNPFSSFEGFDEIIFDGNKLRDTGILRFASTAKKVVVQNVIDQSLRFSDEFKFLKEVEVKNSSIDFIEGLGLVPNFEKISLVSTILNFEDSLDDLRFIEDDFSLYLILSSVTDLNFISNLNSLFVRTEIDENKDEISEFSVVQSLDNLNFINAHPNIEKLSVIRSGLSNISGIENLVSLTGLRLGGNAIVSLAPLSSLVNLNSLSLRNNQIRDVSPLVSLEGLEKLYLDDNQIADFGVLESLYNLDRIYISGNISEECPSQVSVCR